MQIKIYHLLDETTDYICSFDVDVVPNIGDSTKIKNPKGDFVDGKVVSKAWDFTRDKPNLKIEVSPL